jgi:hypothetical protein
VVRINVQHNQPVGTRISPLLEGYVVMRVFPMGEGFGFSTERRAIAA